MGGVRTSRLSGTMKQIAKLMHNFIFILEPPIAEINKISVAKFRHLAHALRKSTVKLHHIPGQKNKCAVKLFFFLAQ